MTNVGNAVIAGLSDEASGVSDDRAKSENAGNGAYEKNAGTDVLRCCELAP